jgi:hypothetical protein
VRLTPPRSSGVRGDGWLSLTDDETVAKLALTIASRGNTRTETLRAFTEEEYWRIVAELPTPDVK